MSDTLPLAEASPAGRCRFFSSPPPHILWVCSAWPGLLLGLEQRPQRVLCPPRSVQRLAWLAAGLGETGTSPDLGRGSRSSRTLTAPTLAALAKGRVSGGPAWLLTPELLGIFLGLAKCQRGFSGLLCL